MSNLSAAGRVEHMLRHATFRNMTSGYSVVDVRIPWCQLMSVEMVEMVEMMFAVSHVLDRVQVLAHSS
jgi:hypothetical protein